MCSGHRDITTRMNLDSQKVLRLGHSPDPDDAFMWYPLANFPNGSGPGGKTFRTQIDTGGYEFVHVLEDIQSLNDRAANAELEITAISIHQYAHVARNYALTSCGASLGDGYGPMVITGQNQLTIEDLKSGVNIAIPGTRTTAHLALQLLLGKGAYEFQVVPFDQIIPRVARGEYDAGLIIHEGQLTYGGAGLRCIVDLGKWWSQTRRLPLPLGGNCIRRDLNLEMGHICTILRQSIEFALVHREDAITYALNYARDMGRDLADTFVGMYVNDWTLDYGEVGRRAVQELLTEAAEAGITPSCGEIDFVEPT